MTGPRLSGTRPPAIIAPPLRTDRRRTPFYRSYDRHRRGPKSNPITSNKGKREPAYLLGGFSSVTRVLSMGLSGMYEAERDSRYFHNAVSIMFYF
ncbi:hypothetical protein AVEN_127783-1 [Araneus ventricosus]|uniref:Uncharacterized protein n=1 Tax=Araneus ventricosus TaxID=182803 RepID=A0A4Y2DNC2_ARAVE|nr:hypothetical protein AVEN_127783-1 [Araneus ventricosus]